MKVAFDQRRQLYNDRKLIYDFCRFSVIILNTFFLREIPFYLFFLVLLFLFRYFLFLWHLCLVFLIAFSLLMFVFLLRYLSLPVSLVLLPPTPSTCPCHLT